MFTLSDEEQATIQKVADIATERSSVNQQIRHLAYSRDAASLEIASALEAKVKDLDQAELDNTRNPTFVTAQVKTLVNQYIEQKLPMPPSDMLTIVEQLLPVFLESPELTRSWIVLKDIMVRTLKLGTDEDVHAARALATVVRYNALCATGLPEPFVQNLMVAEAGKQLQGVADLGQKLSTLAASTNLRLH